ncbi:MAG: GatB/YqeY domain-containing protein [Bacteroidales bacterium]|nr:GatB/YqeY domain-containing protein [Bacteroidales bacterium]
MSTLFNKVNEDIQRAILNQEKEKLETLRSIKTAFLIAKSENNQMLSEEKEIQILQKLYKQRLDAAEIYKQNNRYDLAEKELAEANIIKQYLPQMLSDEELESEIKKIIEDLKVSDIKEMGKVMSIALRKLAGKTTNKDIAEKVKKLLQK